MDTLSKTQNSAFFASAGDYENLCRKWSALVNTRHEEMGAEHHLLYLALRGKNWRTAFTPISNTRKLQNGAFYDWALHRALRRIHHEVHAEELLRPFSGIINTATLEKVRRVLPKSVSGFEIANAYEVADAG